MRIRDSVKVNRGEMGGIHIERLTINNLRYADDDITRKTENKNYCELVESVKKNSKKAGLFLKYFEEG